MNGLRGIVILWGVFICFNAGAEPALDKGAVDAGREIYMRLCASCHGHTAKGDGVVTEILKVAPPNLTTIAARNGGVFNSHDVQAHIDGRERVQAHGTVSMPVWGEKLGAKEGASPVEQDIRLRTRLFALVMYIKSIQVPAGTAP
jgi:mono/diheme cytochrome c family protein